jgi:hypothetical protein
MKSVGGGLEEAEEGDNCASSWWRSKISTDEGESGKGEGSTSTYQRQASNVIFPRMIDTLLHTLIIRQSLIQS